MKVRRISPIKETRVMYARKMQMRRKPSITLRTGSGTGISPEIKAGRTTKRKTPSANPKTVPMPITMLVRDLPKCFVSHFSNLVSSSTFKASAAKDRVEKERIML